MSDPPSPGSYDRSTRAVIIFVVAFVWLVWLAMYLYMYVYVPAWQRDQASQIEAALAADCAIKFTVNPITVRLSDRPTWMHLYPPTGKLLECRRRVRDGQWICSGCAGGP